MKRNPPYIGWRWAVLALIAGSCGIACGQKELILAGAGITGVSIGDEAEELAATLGAPEEKTSIPVAGGESPPIEYFLYPSRGFDLLIQDGRVRTIFLYNEGAEDHRRFPGQTPDGIHLDSTRMEVVQLLGPPDEKGDGAFEDRLYKYHYGIEFIFRPDDTIHHVVLSAPGGGPPAP